MYDADSFSNWLKKFFTTGVFEGDCQVTALGSMVVNLAPGYANIMGKVKELENQTFTLEPADGQYPRIDTIVIERNDTDRDITAKVVTGQLSGNNPIPTSKVWENGIYQLIVAEVYVAAGATEVTQADITDKRSDPDVCGIVAGTVTEMDFSQFTAQFEAYFAEFEASNLTEFEDWFQHMKDQLDTDAAGHLQNEIDDLTGVVTGIGNRVTTLEGDLSGFKFYPTGTGIVGLISDDSAYTDEDGNYVVWGTPTAEQLVEDNPNTYKSVPSTEDLRGKVGADTGVPFSSRDDLIRFNFYRQYGINSVAMMLYTTDVGYFPSNKSNPLFTVTKTCVSASDHLLATIKLTANKAVKIRFKIDYTEERQDSVYVASIEIKHNNTDILTKHAESATATSNTIEQDITLALNDTITLNFYANYGSWFGNIIVK